jgi:cation:H+ antiporter
VAALGGASFLRGVLGVAAWLRLPKLLVATTLAAFATSSPEMAVSSLAALSGRPGIGLGGALGSDVVKLGLILGIALLFGPPGGALGRVPARLCTRTRCARRDVVPGP